MTERVRIIKSVPFTGEEEYGYVEYVNRALARMSDEGAIRRYRQVLVGYTRIAEEKARQSLGLDLSDVEETLTIDFSRELNAPWITLGKSRQTRHGVEVFVGGWYSEGRQEPRSLSRLTVRGDRDRNLLAFLSFEDGIDRVRLELVNGYMSDGIWEDGRGQLNYEKILNVLRGIVGERRPFLPSVLGLSWIEYCNRLKRELGPAKR